MSQRHDSFTTIFSPEGRLYQVEYAMEAIRNTGSAIGILSKDGVVLVGEKKVTSKLLQTSTSSEKMYKIDDHVACVVAGVMSDANILINTAMVQAQRYTFSYKEPMPVEQLVQSVCDTNFLGKAVGVRFGSQTAPAIAAPAKEAVKPSDDDINLFGEETKDEKKAGEAREATKASIKNKESGKSSVLIDFKPWDDETKEA
ncbi:Proteasome subunit alpha type-4 [Capsicum chinense]|nr:Proteasome subunit alpha type-4 [Capsicum chinense]